MRKLNGDISKFGAEEMAILDALEAADYNMRDAASLLGIAHDSIYRRLKAWGVVGMRDVVRVGVTRIRRQIAEQELKRRRQDHELRTEV